MFGIFKFRASVKATTGSIIGLLAPARVSSEPYGSLPSTVFADAYVIGFLQSFSVFAMIQARGSSIKPEEQFAIFQASMDHFLPGLGKKMPAILPQLNEPSNVYYTHYSVGKKEGEGYVNALVSGDETKALEFLNGFTDFIKRNHLGISV